MSLLHCAARCGGEATHETRALVDLVRDFPVLPLDRWWIYRDGLLRCTPPCPGDTDFDGFVNFNDLNVVLGNWNQPVPPRTRGDQDADGDVDFDDLNAVLANWNADCG